jgi:hypothetical protein
MFEQTSTSLRIGIIDYHDDFTRILMSLIPRHHEVLVYTNMPPPSADRVEGAVDLLLNHHEAWFNDRYNVPTLVVPYGTVKSSHVRQWSANPNIVGVIDMSSMLASKFLSLRLPIFAFTPTHPFCMTTKGGDKVISLIIEYEKRFPTEFAIAEHITPHLIGNSNKDYRHEQLTVRDLDALTEAKWLLHIKHNGFVCNAVMKALACGVPVLMDTKTYEACSFEGILRHDHNAIILPADELKEFVETCSPEQYDRIKTTCMEEAHRYRKGIRWCDGWWGSGRVA